MSRLFLGFDDTDKGLFWGFDDNGKGLMV